MTLQDAKRIVRDLGFSLTRKDGEYRLAPLPLKGAVGPYAGTPAEGRRPLSPAEREAKAYYTPDMDDALGTAWDLAAHNCA